MSIKYNVKNVIIFTLSYKYTMICIETNLFDFHKILHLLSLKKQYLMVNGCLYDKADSGIKMYKSLL